MPNFTIRDRASPRFAGDLEAVPAPGQAPTDEEVAFLAAVNKALDAIAAEITAEDAEQLRDTLHSARRSWRSTAIAKLRGIAEDAAAGRIQIAAASESLSAAEAGRLASKPDVVIESAKDDKARFRGEFTVTCVNYTPEPVELAFLKRLRDTLDFLAKQEGDDKNSQFSDAVLAARQELRKNAADELRTNVRWWREGTDSAGLANSVLIVRGGYEALCKRLGQSLFAVNVVREDAEERLAYDLKIRVERDLPPPNDVVSPEKQDLFVQLNNACAVIRTVCQQIRDRAETKFRKTTENVDADAIRRARQMLDEYVNKLAGIGRLGLEGSHTALAKLALTSLKSEFVAHEAGRIKNRYVRRLGLWSFVFGSLFLAAYASIKFAGCTPAPVPQACVWWDSHKMFLLAATGATVGTWVSFAIRRLDLSFDELTLLEEASLDPPFRIVFVVALTFIICLLFWTGATNIEIGNLKTGPDYFKANGSIAILIGMFCGLSERALATAVSGRAAAFVKGVAGGG